MYSKRVTISCDSCSEWEELATNSATDARSMLREEGWACSSERDLCPDYR